MNNSHTMKKNQRSRGSRQEPEKKSNDILLFLLTVAVLVILWLFYFHVEISNPNYKKFLDSLIPNWFGGLLVFLLIYFYLRKYGILSEREGLINVAAIELDESNKKFEEIKGLLSFEQKLKKFGIVNVFCNRKEYYEELKNELAEIEKKVKISKKEEIKLIGFSLRDFFNFQRGPVDELPELIIKLTHENRIGIQALTILPKCQQAEFRRESDEHDPHGGKSCIPQDLGNTLDFFNKNRAINEFIDIKFYTDIPSTCFMVIFKNYVVVEQYYNGGIGGEIPLIKYNIDSAAGEKLSRHFSYMWNHPTTQKELVQ